MQYVQTQIQDYYFPICPATYPAKMRRRLPILPTQNREFGSQVIFIWQGVFAVCSPLLEVHNLALLLGRVQLEAGPPLLHSFYGKGLPWE